MFSQIKDLIEMPEIECQTCTLLNNDRRANCSLCRSVLIKPNKISDSTSDNKDKTSSKNYISNPDQESFNSEYINPSDIPITNHENDPLPGWRKQISVNMKTSVKINHRGNVTITYFCPNEYFSPLTTKETIINKLIEIYNDPGLIKRFTLQKIYCVCHQETDKKNNNFFECKFGKAGKSYREILILKSVKSILISIYLLGCNGKFHPSCVGKKMDDIYEGPFICPLCTEYLEKHNLTGDYNLHKYYFSPTYIYI